MTKLTNAIVLGLLVLGLLVMPAAAQSGTGLPVLDTYVSDFYPSAPQDGAQLWLDAATPPNGSCTPTGYIYLKWSLTGYTEHVTGAVLTLTTAAFSSNAIGETVTLYRLADNWDASATWNNRLTPGAVIQTLVLPLSLAKGTRVTFSDSNITTYLNEEIDKADGFVSFALAFTSCKLASSQEFEDSEGGALVSPFLEAPTAVALSSFAAGKSTPTWPLYAGLGTVALVVIAGLAVSRRRTA